MTEVISTPDLKIAVFEDQKSFLAALGKFLQYMKDLRPPVDLTEFRDNDDPAFWREALNECSLALVDLELGGSFGQSPSDYDGLEKILPRLREVAPWLPAVLMSVYFVHSHLDLLRVAEGDFDALLPKDVFKSCTAEEWGRFCEAVAINRIAATTSRSVKAVRECYEFNLDLEMGRGVDKLVAAIGESAVKDVIKLLGLGRRIVLDLVSPGFSGLAVVKATVSDGERDGRWLIKMGRRLDKLVTECDAYTAMLIDGYARRISAPLLYKVPVVWAGCGAIVYEFEEHSRSLRDLLQREGLDRVISVVAPMLKRFWSPLAEVQVIPRAALDFGGLLRCAEAEPAGCAIRDFASMIQGTVDNPLLDRSAATLIGRQHGDLHSLNVLVTNNDAMMIDFAHYRGRDRRGIPLLDVIKLAFDLWAFGKVDWTAQSLINGSAFRAGSLAMLLNASGLVMRDPQNDDMIRLARLACVAEGGRYLGYPDVPNEKKVELRSALQMHLLEIR